MTLKKTESFRLYTTSRYKPPRLQQWWQSLEEHGKGEWRDVAIVVDEDFDHCSTPPDDGP